MDYVLFLDDGGVMNDNALRGPQWQRWVARIFADAGVAPAEALVVDDNPLALRWAAEAGARTVFVGSAGARRPRRTRSSAAWPSCRGCWST
jgi:hypothetical protein